jgi:membrane protein implicated in regulation of membrane protease activity
VDDPEQWRWVWMVAALVFLVGEMFSPGSFFLLPFALGAAVAAVLAFADVDAVWQWLAFVGLSVAFFAALRPLARRLDTDAPTSGIGAKRLIGEVGTVLEPITGDGDLGMVRIHREEWRAESIDETAIALGTRVRVVEVRGTRVVVLPAEAADPAVPPSSPPADTAG